MVLKADWATGDLYNASDQNAVAAQVNTNTSDIAGKVDKNTAVTPATKTKVTYDAKGLVTAGADATTADIADSTDKRYVTDAQKTVLGNTSGTNTGDQDLSGLVPNTRTVAGKPLSANVTLAKADVGLGSVDNTADAAKVVASAAKLTTPRTINGVAFDGTGNITVADGTKEPAITAGTAAQYRRGDKTWQTLNAAAVAGLGTLATVSPSGTPDGTKFLRDDNTWQTPAGGGSTKTGMLEPVQAHCRGDETYTIVSGSVTQIAGLTISGGSYAPAVGDRILIANAPTGSGAGSAYGFPSRVANGIYVVTNNTTNLSLSRAPDMSGSINPAGLSVFSESPNLAWLAQAVFTVVIPNTPAAFTYGTGSIQFKTTSGVNITPDSVYISNGSVSLYNSTIYNDTNVSVNPAATATQNLTLPPATTALIDGEQFCTLTSTYRLSTGTGAQKLFNTSTNGRVTLPVGTHFFECYFDLSGMSASSASFGWTLAAGTATIAAIKWRSEASKAALATAAAPQCTVNTAANTAITTANANTIGWARITGKVRISAAGTVIPQVSLGASSSTADVGADSYFRIWQVGSNTVTQFGDWS